ncbi:hypothetical protein HDU87_005882 [Geranomyces variabilis]|uniref:Uncharacterized protein n=1 Tax=Geranomyces variabilis TaxID=109894 RepID=A0AAD5TSW6_9FUNG|nr:hypothetical protein HDU87_005882 [Geranomyces variabilis]
MTVLAPAFDAEVSIIRYPCLLRVSHDSYMGETSRPKLEADSTRLLAASLRAWLARVVPAVAAIAVERHKLVATYGAKVDENMVLAALRVVDPGCVPPLLSLRLANDDKSDETTSAEPTNSESNHNNSDLSHKAGAH